MKIEGRHIWLVGASEGIGRCLASELVGKGARVTISARNAERLAALAAEHPNNMHAAPADVQSLESVQAAYASAAEHFGEPDIIVFNAGVYTPSTAQVADLRTALSTVDINFNGFLRVWEVARTHMLNRKSGRLVIVSSVAAYRGLPTSYAYGASKAALTNLAETMRLELAQEGIVVQLVSPGFVETRLTAQNTFAMPAIITPEKAAKQIVAGIESDQYEIHFPKRFSHLMKLLRIVPNRVFFWAAKKGML